MAMGARMILLRKAWLLFGKLWALAFIFFGGCLLALFVIPLFSLLPAQNTGCAQMLIHRSFRFYLWAIQFFGLVEVQIQDAEKLAACTGKIIIANHPSLLDVVMIMATIPKTQCIIKHQLWNSPLLGGLMRRAGYIRNDLGPEQLIASCQASLDEGRCLIIFPEGTRTLVNKRPRFHRGFANVATLTNSSIQPLFITCDPPFLFKGEPWWHVPAGKPLFRVKMGEHIDANTYSLYGQRSLAARKLVELLELYYATQANDRES